jgi:nitroimidazol reductase NimA-like FMN-containing flavoprotein (pyridoxamine 5'-phosphate oxidase superfamily)
MTYDTDRDIEPVEELSDLECWEHLRAQEFGRLAFHLVGEVHITPINYATDGRRLYFRTAEGSKLLGVTMNDDVALEIDEFDEHHASSVVVRGRAVALEGHLADVVEDLPLRPWVPTEKHVVVAITPTEITGRHFRLERPWTHLRPEG